MGGWGYLLYKQPANSWQTLSIWIINAKNIRQNIRYCRKRSYKDFQEDKFLEEVDKISWWEVYSCNDVDLAVDIFTKKLTDILDKMAPLKRFQIKTKYATWVSDATKDRLLLSLD